MHEPFLVAENLSISFGEVRALDDVSVSIKPGEIRCLVGENGCGKSTFVKIVSGVYVPDKGTVSIDAKEVEHGDPRAAIDAGVQVIYQDLSLFDHLSVAENIAINQMLNEGNMLVNRRKIHEIAAEQLLKIGITLPLNDRVSTLSMANKQLVAIARALSMDAKIIFMDEPTTAITSKEVKRLLEIVRDLASRGISIVFISHKLDEVFDVADTITVFRDGKKIGDFQAKDLNIKKLGYYMTGREISYNKYVRAATATEDTDEPVLEVRNLSRSGNYENVNLRIMPGDIVGLTGLIGSGRTEFGLSLFGLNAVDSGQILVDGKEVSITDPWIATDLGIMLIPEDRATQGLFRQQNVRHNLSSASLNNLRNKWGLFSRQQETELAHRMVHEMGVNNKDIGVLAGNLSGGNQQKIVIGKWIANDPKVLVLDSPTVGIDIGSKSEIYDQVQRLAEQGTGVLLISDEPEEIAATCNKVIVMHEGEVIRTIDRQVEVFDDFVADLAEMITSPESVSQDFGQGDNK